MVAKLLWAAQFPESGNSCLFLAQPSSICAQPLRPLFLPSILLLNANGFVFAFHSLTSLFERSPCKGLPSSLHSLIHYSSRLRSLPQLHRAPRELPLRDHSYRRPINLSPFSILRRENICPSHSKRPLCSSKPLTQLLPGPKAYWKYFSTLAYNTSPQLERQEPFHHTEGFGFSV